MRRLSLLLTVLVVALSGCRQSRPLLRTLPAGATALEAAIEIPDGYDVRTAGFGASYNTHVSGGSGSSTQQPYVYVHAVERATGQNVLLVYGDIRRRAEPVLIVRMQPERAATAGR